MKLLLPTAAEAARPDALSPLEERLRGPGAAQTCEQTLSQLKGLEQRTRARISAGVAPDGYRCMAALLDACLAAQEVLERCTPPADIDMRSPSRLPQAAISPARGDERT